jgi:hypothetical protein
MTADHFISYRSKYPIGTLGALYGRFSTNSGYPFIYTNRGVAFVSGLFVYPQFRIYIFPSSE